jgi:hypothetical protein
MSAGWVAPMTRGRALLERTIGLDGARRLAAAESWPAARERLAPTVYGIELASDANRAQARHAAATAATWQLRVLAGWLPPGSSGLARLVAGPIEISNIEQHLAWLTLGTTAHSVPLGSLGTAWPVAAATTSPEALRGHLARSSWGDPGGSDPVTLAVGLRVGWLRRLSRQLPVAREIALGGLAILIARERFAFEREIAPIPARELDRLVGNGWRRAETLTQLTERLPRGASWALSGIVSPADIWRAELAWLERAEGDAQGLAASRRFGRNEFAAVMALLMVDLQRVESAIEIAGRTPIPGEVFDDVA